VQSPKELSSDIMSHTVLSKGISYLLYSSTQPSAALDQRNDLP
jgi:hypothetical protein